jgi:hypothetical protein
MVMTYQLDFVTIIYSNMSSENNQGIMKLNGFKGVSNILENTHYRVCILLHAIIPSLVM